MKSFGAYRGSFDPSVVFVYAMAHAPGGRFAAIRVGERAELTVGELVEDFEPVKGSEARAAFDAAWRVFMSKRTETDFQEWREQQAWTAEKYRRFDRGERMPPDWRSATA